MNEHKRPAPRVAGLDNVKLGASSTRDASVNQS